MQSKVRVAILLSVLAVLVLGLVQRAEAGPAIQSSTSPRITSFTTSATSVDREALKQRSARVPVSWTTANRPLFANLVFDQVLPDGSEINVELPRPLPWVNSNGDGVAAPVYPGDGVDEIRLRVRLFHMQTREVYDEEFITLPITTGSNNQPTISSFTTTLSSVPRNTETLVPVAWNTRNRPLSATLVFDQVLPDGDVVNVELPRENPWVASAGTGLTDPNLFIATDSIRLRLQLIETSNQFVYDEEFINLSLTDEPAPDPEITLFRANDSSVQRSKLIDRTARVNVSWTVINRPANSNLVFEQVLPSGSIVNVELPRPIEYVASSGSGDAAPVLPGGNVNNIVLRVRLVNLGDNSTLTSRQITVPIVTGTACAHDFFASDPAVQQGKCPTSAPVKTDAAYQRFENGAMIWNAHTDRITVLFDNGVSISFPDTWNDETINFGQNPPPGLEQPVRGFGKVWLENPSVRNDLGWATAAEQAYQMTWQQIDQTQNPPFSGAIYATLPDDRVVRYNQASGLWTYVT